MPVLSIILYLVGIGMLICDILILIKMFQDGSIVLGILGIFCGLIPFIVGWSNAQRWNVKNVMLIWTVLLLLDMVLGFTIGFTLRPH